VDACGLNGAAGNAGPCGCAAGFAQVGLAHLPGGVTEIVDCKRYAIGTIAATYKNYPTSGQIQPAMGYSDGQITDLGVTVNTTLADIVVEGMPIDLTRILKANKPIEGGTYELEEIESCGAICDQHVAVLSC
jgi:predicted GTPase